MPSSIQSDSLAPTLHAGVAPLRLLPHSRAARVAVWLVVGAATALVFSAWLRPNMIFDLADMVFCN